MTFGPFRVDRVNGVLYRDGVALPLPPRAFGVLLVLLAHPDQVVSKQALLDEVWKDTHVTDTSLAEAVSLLRQALGDDPQRGDFIRTVPRRGYRFVARVEPAVAAGPAPHRAVTGEAERLWTPWLPWVLTVVGGVLVTSVIWSLRPRVPVPRDTIARFSIDLPPGFHLADDRRSLAAAPDSSAIAFVAVADAGQPLLFVRSLAEATSRRLPGTEGADAPFFSPDGRAVGYFAGGALWRIDLEHADPRSLAAAPSAAGAVWTARGQIVFAPRWGEGLSVVDAEGGPVTAVTSLDRATGETRHAWPQTETRTGAILFTCIRSTGVDEIGEVRIWSPSTSRTTTLLKQAAFPQIFPTGYLVAWRRSQPLVAEVDGTALAVTREPVTVAPTVVTVASGEPMAALSSRGALVSAGGSGRTGLSWITPTGRRTDGPWSDRLTPISLLSDGVSLLASSAQSAVADYRIVDLSRGTELRALLPRLSATSLHATTTTGVGTGLDIAVAQGEQVRARVATPADETDGAISPDGRLLSWQANATGQWQITLAPIDDVGAARMVAPGTSPVWSRDGRTLWFLLDGALMASAVDPVAGTTQPAQLVASGVGRILGTAPDGRVLVVTRPASITSLDVVLGWAEEVRARLEREPRFPRSFR